MSPLNPLFRYTITLAALVSFAGAEEKSAPIRVLDTAGKHAKKLEVRHSMLGFRNTLIFYTFEEQQAVLRVAIDNKTKKFAVTATVYLFADDVSADGLKKWLNNQHSDGLFPDVPKPVATFQVPEKSCSKESHKLIDHSKTAHGEYDNYAVEFRIAEVSKKGAFKLKSFTSETRVHVKTQ